MLTVVGRRLHRLRSNAGISDVGEEVDARLHESDLKTERVVTRRVVQVKPGRAEQPVQRPVPAVQVVLIQLV